MTTCLWWPEGQWHRIRPEEIQQVPWKNGAGLTRTLWHQGDESHYLRISLADITGNSGFSRFENTQRCLALVQGELTLSINGVGRQVKTGDWLHFSGEDLVDASQLKHPHCKALNLMVPFGTGRFQLQRVSLDAGRSLGLNAGPDQGLFCISGGGVLIHQNLELKAGEMALGGGDALKATSPSVWLHWRLMPVVI
ncbi:HutD family protein [Pokkaliibacter sp. CJK22405]|uniref:HutD family protein n=1 Tax=Pokkaliibacter sp. CJK22405 TaxID=3384615 RepID=UPI00398561DA